MGVPSLNDLAVDGTLNTTNQPTSGTYFRHRVGIRLTFDSVDIGCLLSTVSILGAYFRHSVDIRHLLSA